MLFFESSRCLRCGLDVGYDPSEGRMCRSDRTLKLCVNGKSHAVCNWLLPDASDEVLCVSCQLNRTIPDLSSESNRTHWSLMESAKRRMLYTVAGLQIALPKLANDPQHGLAFDIVSTTLDPTATTGHLRGVITVSLEEADDTWRQINRAQLGEASRTLLGHFRHEIGHYLWYRCLSRLEWNHPWREAFREIYGSEAIHYSNALTHHYQQGPRAGWQHHFISAYASSHPWEDWAETMAHYLQIVDVFETCEHLGIRSYYASIPTVHVPLEACTLPPCLGKADLGENHAFHQWLQRWVCLAIALNETSRSFGAPLLYPFTISIPVARKLRLAWHFAALWRDANQTV